LGEHMSVHPSLLMRNNFLYRRLPFYLSQQPGRA